MYTSDKIYPETGKRKTTYSKTVFLHGFIIMTVLTLLCLLFSTIYNYFGHGVHSFFMTYLFLFPFILGMLVYGILILVPRAKNPTRFAYNLYNSGIITLIVGSTLRGIFFIAGTSSPFEIFYWIFGIAMLILGIGNYLIYLFREPVPY